MDTTTISASITYPTSEIEAFADRLGYFPEVMNPAYSETVEDDGTITDNGEPRTIPNPQDKIEFVKEKWLTAQSDWFGQFIDKDEQNLALQTAKTTAETKKQLIKDAINFT